MAYTNTNTNSNSTSYDNVKSDVADISKDATASMDKISSDLRTLKSDVADLGRQATQEGKKRLNEKASQVQDRVSDLKALGEKEFSGLKSYVSENPGQSVAYAFAAGLIASFLLGRR